jgi:hypothetical protein
MTLKVVILSKLIVQRTINAAKDLRLLLYDARNEFSATDR